MLKKLGALAVLLSLSLFAVGCGGTPEAAPAPEESGETAPTDPGTEEAPADPGTEEAPADPGTEEPAP